MNAIDAGEFGRRSQAPTARSLLNLPTVSEAAKSAVDVSRELGSTLWSSYAETDGIIIADHFVVEATNTTLAPECHLTGR